MANAEADPPTDPDEGRELRPDFRAHLEERRAGFLAERQSVSLEEAFASVTDD